MSRARRWWPPTGRGASSGPIDWLFVGLGNPGARYDGTRHNIGREAVVRVAAAFGTTLGQLKHNALCASVTMLGQRVLLATPTTYMNESGRAVAPLARFYRVAAQNIVLLYDDIDLPLGFIRLRAAGGAGGHNGAGSVFKAIGTQDVPRIRIGVGRPPPQWDPADYVLSRFTADERVIAEQAVRDAAEAIEAIVRDGLASAMNAYN